MADLVIEPANVQAQSSSDVSYNGRAAGPISAGQVVYRAPDGRWALADSDAADVGRIPAGMALNSAAAAGQPLAVLLSGDVAVGEVLTAGQPYYLSETPGGLQPIEDLGVGEEVAQFGIARTTSVLHVRILAPGVTIPA